MSNLIIFLLVSLQTLRMMPSETVETIYLNHLFYAFSKIHFHSLKPFGGHDLFESCTTPFGGA